MLDRHFGAPPGGWRLTLYNVIFKADTHAGRLFDLTLIWAIALSVLVVVLDSVQSISAHWGAWFYVLEWGFTLAFTAEYIARLLCVQRPARYARSFYGVVDLVSVLPTYLAILVPGLSSLIDVRVLRLLRIARLFKLSAYSQEFRTLARALSASRRKITVFVGVVMMVVLVLGTLMYVVEGPENGFTSIPAAVYWAIATMTTVGFGDLVPKTDLGRAIASMMMLLGWGVLAVPTGIVSAEMVRGGHEDDFARRMAGQGSGPAGPAGSADDPDARQPRQPNVTASTGQPCPSCGAVAHEVDAHFCRRCGVPLREAAADR